MIDKFRLIVTTSIFSLMIASPTYSQSANLGSSISASGNVHFSPRPASVQHIDYEAWSDLLEVMVLSTGQSTRTSAPRATPNIGSRIILTHTSPYRLEGNKIAFSRFAPKFTALISDYRQELEEVGNSINIEELSKNEQLAYWMNLHNVVIIEQIALAYPIVKPTALKVGPNKDPLHEAKIINIKGQALSLRDIREDIVYKNWNDSAVIYGFFLGDLGSPSIQNYAFNAENVQTALDIIGYEYANSLRGFRQGRVSKVYSDVQAYFFPDFQKDLRIHLRKYMRDEVAEELSRYDNLKDGRYPYRIADVVGGYDRGQGNAFQSFDRDSTINPTVRNPAFDSFLNELREKYRKLNRLGLTNRGTVIIEDIETIVNDNEPHTGN